MDNAIQVENTPTQQPVVEQQQEAMVPQSKVNELVGRVRHEAAQKAVEDYKRQQVERPTSYAENTHRNQYSEEDIRRLTSDQIGKEREKLEQEYKERSDKEAADRIVNAYHQKVELGKQKYEDFEEVTKTLDMRPYPNVVAILADYVDNSEDVLYDLARNRTKLSQIESLCHYNPQDALYEMKRLSESIKQNNSSSYGKTPRNPLSQQRPSNTGTDSGGSSAMSIQDFKKCFKV